MRLRGARLVWFIARQLSAEVKIYTICLVCAADAISFFVSRYLVLSPSNPTLDTRENLLACKRDLFFGSHFEMSTRKVVEISRHYRSNKKRRGGKTIHFDLLRLICCFFILIDPFKSGGKHLLIFYRNLLRSNTSTILSLQFLQGESDLSGPLGV